MLSADARDEVSWVALKEVLQAVRYVPTRKRLRKKLRNSWRTLIGGSALLLHRKQPGGQRLWLHEVCADSRVLTRSPPVRTKSPALQARLSELQKQVEQRQYDAMVRDVTHAVRTCQPRHGYHEAARACMTQPGTGIRTMRSAGCTLRVRCTIMPLARLRRSGMLWLLAKEGWCRTKPSCP